MGRLFVITLDGSSYKCKHCQTHLALADHIISKSFHCSHGKAYLFDKVVNVTIGEREERMMMTGMHTVVDIFCVGCGSIVGWKYVRKPRMTRPKSTRKGNSFLRDLRSQVQMEASIQ
ncbi:unnamed protein product [Withania somnifera]